VDVNTQLTNKLYAQDKKLVPGFSTNSKNRPLIIQNLERYFEEKHLIIHSIRFINELQTFIWKDGRAQAQSGKNDDLVIAFGIALWVRDTAMRLQQQGLDLTRRTLSMIQHKSDFNELYNSNNTNDNPYKWKTAQNETIDLRSWF